MAGKTVNITGAAASVVLPQAPAQSLSSQDSRIPPPPDSRDELKAPSLGKTIRFETKHVSNMACVYFPAQQEGNVLEIPAKQEGIMPGYEYELSVSSPREELSSLCKTFAGHFCHVPVVTSSAGQAAIPDSFTPAPIRSHPIPEVPISGIRAQKAGILKQASGVKSLGESLSPAALQSESGESSASVARLTRPLSFVPEGPSGDPWRGIITDSHVDSIDKLTSLHANPQSSFPALQGKFDFKAYLASIDGRLSFFAPSANPDRQVGLLLHGKSGKMEKVFSSRMLLDLGSNIFIMDDLFASEHDIPVYSSPLRMATANGSLTSTQRVTGPITVSYGTALHADHHFVIVPYRSDAPFRILIGNCDGMRWGGSHDIGASA